MTKPLKYSELRALLAEREEAHALIEKMAEALKEYVGVCRSHNDPNDFTPRVVDEGFYARDSLSAYRQWKEKK